MLGGVVGAALATSCSLVFTRGPAPAPAVAGGDCSTRYGAVLADRAIGGAIGLPVLARTLLVLKDFGTWSNGEDPPDRDWNNWLLGGSFAGAVAMLVVSQVGLARVEACRAAKGMKTIRGEVAKVQAPREAEIARRVAACRAAGVIDAPIASVSGYTGAAIEPPRTCPVEPGATAPPGPSGVLVVHGAAGDDHIVVPGCETVYEGCRGVLAAEVRQRIASRTQGALVSFVDTACAPSGATNVVPVTVHSWALARDVAQVAAGILAEETVGPDDAVVISVVPDCDRGRFEAEVPIDTDAIHRALPGGYPPD